MSIDKKNKKANIKYLAKLAGVSISTVSRALNRSPEASEKTIARINELAKRVGYYPDSIAKGLRINKTHTIGVIFNDIQDPFFSDILWTINEELYQFGYSTIICYSNWQVNRERANIINLLSKKVDGIIMTPIEEDSKNIDLLINNNIETVFVDSFSKHTTISYACSNHAKAAYLGTEYLLKCGHKDILLVCAIPASSFSKLFIKGYKKALNNYKIKIRNDLIFNLDSISHEYCYNIFKDIISKNKNKFTGVMITSDFIAICFYKATNDLGLKIPQNYSIVGYDDIIISSALSPPLTTVSQSRKEIGYNAVQILINNIENKKNKIFKKVIIEPLLVERNSVKKIN